MEFLNKNDYTVIVFFADKQPYKMAYVHNCYSCAQWLSRSQNHSNWLYINVYARRSGRYIKRFYNGNFIDAKPK